MDVDALSRAFVTVFATMNALAVLPLVVKLLGGLSPEERRKAGLRAVITGTVVACTLAVAGRPVFGFLGIRVSDMRIAGGLVLLVFAIHDLLFSPARRKGPGEPDEDHDLALVPLGVPILVGPASMAAVLVAADSAGVVATVLSVLAISVFNLVMVGAAPRVLGLLGPQVTRAFGKVMSLFLAAIAVSMIRVGLTDALAWQASSHPEAHATLPAPRARLTDRVATMPTGTASSRSSVEPDPRRR